MLRNRVAIATTFSWLYTKSFLTTIICFYSTATSDLALTRGDADGALAMLKEVTAEQPIYVKARQKIAEIYLHHKKDKRQFAVCYKLASRKPVLLLYTDSLFRFRELVDKNPTPQAFVLLGDAYMSIQEVNLLMSNRIKLRHFYLLQLSG